MAQTPTQKQVLSLRPTVVDIDLDALAANFERIKALAAPAKVMPVLKANAYGHGLVASARVLEQCGAAAVGVAYLEEGMALRRAGLKLPILSLSGISCDQLSGFLDYGIDITASSLMKLEAVEEQAAARGVRARVHLKIDTGMERTGVHYYSAEKLLVRALTLRHSEVVGIYSHFATSESEDLSFTRSQLERFLECCSFFEKQGHAVPLRHIANTAALLRLPESRLDMVRPGLMLYGVSPSSNPACRMDLTPVLALRSKVVYFKVVQAEAGVSYDLTWRAPKQTRVITVPIGYGDGYSRRLSNCGGVLVRGRRYPIVGRVCMDQIMVDIGDGEAYNGDEVVLIGNQAGQRITVEEIAELTEMDPREVCLSLNSRVPKRFHYQGREWVEE
ncbi:MAG: alanine racemase [Deltaproteobacteria bacterium]|nr:alanine racemase [Deltaproteobacteria bacterium]